MRREQPKGKEIRLLAEIVRLLKVLVEEEEPKLVLPTNINFKENIMGLSAVGGNTLVYTGSLSPAGSTLPADAVVTATSNDTAVSPTVDGTGLIVTIPLPTDWTGNATSPLAIAYSATSASNPSWSLSATITPSVPAVLPSGITFTQTT